ncbi:MAG: 4Fe-4S dicluster domain-containing protein [Candidatus Limivicinus sp.]
MLYEIYFSPTGGTEKVSEKLSAAWSCEKTRIDLLKNDYSRYIPELSGEDVCIFSLPVFGGRIPRTAAERLRHFRGSSAAAVITAVFGNRAVDDALAETEDILSDCGFRIVAGIEAAAEHSLAPEYGTGRPDEDDGACLINFGRQIAAKLARGDFSRPALPGNRPYREIKSGPLPQVSGPCANCGICARECPAGAIMFASPWTADLQKCISCMHCVKICPENARSADRETLKKLSEHLRPVCTERKPNRLYI